jgi:hypothetical protein
MIKLETFAIDEYGVGYSPETFYTVEDAESFITTLEDSLEDATISQAHSIRQTILDLEDQLRNYKETAD